MKKFFKSPLNIIINKSLINLPTPINISILWNFGSILGLCLIIQLITGFILSIHYTPHTIYAFNRIIHIIENINYGWIIRLTHINTASIFFFCLYIHIGRGIYYRSYKLLIVWIIGVIIIFILIATAFVGYVLPWGQISFWGATVITNLLSAIPFIGQPLVEWLWGGFSINNATLNRFFSFHFILPFILLIIVLIHLFFLHQTGSNNPLGTPRKLYIIKFHIYFTLKDTLGFLYIFYFLLIISLEEPYLLGDSENFIIANPIITPIHIQPEWYFLFAYTILRSIPNKLGGVLALIISIIILTTLPFTNKSNFQRIRFFLIKKFIFWKFFIIFIILTWLGSQPIESPFTPLSQFITFIYFLYFLITPIINI